MAKNRLDKENAKKKLASLPYLSEVLGENWLDVEYKKPIEQWSLITGWISLQDEFLKYDNWTWEWLTSLNGALGYLKTCTKPNLWRKIAGKIRSHTDRANFKGTLSEIAMCVFLSSINVSYEMEIRLVSGKNKDIDIQAQIDNKESVNIEIQWLSPSDVSEKGAEIASAYGEGYPIDYEYEMRRIKQKVFDKTAKFTENDITFVALDCTTSPELGGAEFSPIKQVLYHSFSKGKLDIDIAIRKYVDAVIWFELQNSNTLMPIKRNLIINPNSLHGNNDSVLKFAEHWKSK